MGVPADSIHTAAYAVQRRGFVMVGRKPG
jgi:hypothetical protein